MIEERIAYITFRSKILKVKGPEEALDEAIADAFELGREYTKIRSMLRDHDRIEVEVL